MLGAALAHLLLQHLVSGSRDGLPVLRLFRYPGDRPSSGEALAAEHGQDRRVGHQEVTHETFGQMAFRPCIRFTYHAAGRPRESRHFAFHSWTGSRAQAEATIARYPSA